MKPILPTVPRLYIRGPSGLLTALPQVNTIEYKAEAHAVHILSCIL